MRFLYLIPILILLVNCTNRTKSTSEKHVLSKEEKFWTWFEANSDVYYEFEENQNELFAQLEHELSKIHPNLTFVFSGISNNKREFIISADGILDAFPAVESLVNKAPTLENWKIIAFRPRLGTEISITYEGLTLDPKDIFFKYGTDHQKKKIGIELFIKNFNESDQRFFYAAFLILDNALGEYDVEKKLGYIEFRNLSEEKNELDLIEFSELPKIVDEYYKN